MRIGIFPRTTSGGISIGAVISLSIAALALVVIFGLGFAKGERDPRKTNVMRLEADGTPARPHQAVAFVTTSEPSSISPSDANSLDHGDSESVREQAGVASNADSDTIMHNGVTVVTPRLLVPVVTNLDFLDQRAEPSSSSASAGVQPSKDNNGKQGSSSVSSNKKQRRLYASRNLRARRSTGSSHTVVVGLAASRRIVRVVER